ncbi:MAG: 16S rRNA (cytosine(967)-C(5))-methyltransferase RsmB [Bacillota bacterium]
MSKDKTRQIEAREAALRALVRVEQDEAYLNLVIPSLVKQMKSEERALSIQLARGTIQHLNTLDWAINLFSRRRVETMTPWLRNLLRVSAYQLIFLDRIPPYAAVDQGVRLARRFGHRGVAGLANAVLRRLAREAGSLPWPVKEDDYLRYLSLTYSYPFWLVSRILERMEPERAEKWCRAGNTPAPVTIRPNRIKVSPGQLMAVLANEGLFVEESSQVPGMLQVGAGNLPAKAEAFKKGLFTIQGESSGLVAPLLVPYPGEILVDLCSAPGGKTTHLAELINDQGLIYAVDRHENRLKLVDKNARRLGFKNITSIQADGRYIARENLPVPAAVLVDAPCSGLGVIRRLPEIKWRRSAEELPEFKKLQGELLEAAAGLLPVGGRLLYSVCTNEPEETEQVVDTFNQGYGRGQFNQVNLVSSLPASLKNYQEEDTVMLYPELHGVDGFFMALWKKGPEAVF